MVKKKPNSSRHVSKTTLLVVGEGPDDQAFIKHMKSQLCASASRLKSKIEKQSGGSPGNIITNAIRKYRSTAFEQRIFVLDSDVTIVQQDRDKARKAGYCIIQWSPVCLEGALLETLGEPVSRYDTAQQLKSRLHPQLAAPHTRPAAYASLFSSEVLMASQNASINMLAERLC